MYHEYSQEELRAYCRSCIESLEIWARRLIHEKMTEKYGKEYIYITLSSGESIIKKEIREHVSKMQEQNPGRFSRPVDTLFIDQIIYFLCKKEWYDLLYKEALDFAYPQGCDEVREFLSRLVPIRNPLSHANPISIRQAEQAICYSHDFIDGLKKYYKAKGEEQVWNVPRIIKIVDSQGNTFNNPSETHGQSSIFKIPNPLQCGDTYSVTIEVDPAFSPTEYDIIWRTEGNEDKKFRNKTMYSNVFTEKDVAELHRIECKIVSHKAWHKYTYHDCVISLHLTVLPPLE